MPPIRLVVTDDGVRLVDAAPSTRATVDAATRYALPRRGGIPGPPQWVHLLRRDAFPLGLLHDVRAALMRDGVRVTIEDARVLPRYAPLRLRSRLALRDYHAEARDRALALRRCVIALPTGSGKTEIALSLMERVDQPALVLVHRRVLLEQWVRRIRAAFGVEVGRVGDQAREVRAITVAMMQSAQTMPPKFFAIFPMTIHDEVHHVPCEIWYQLATRLRSEYAIGLSATPFRADGKDMLIRAGCGPIAYRASLSALIERGFLARPLVEAIEVEPVRVPIGGRYLDVYYKAIVHNRERNLRIAARAVEASLRGKTYVHVRLVRHGAALARLINKLLPRGARPAVWLYGADTTERREDVLRRFRHGDVDILVSDLLGEGVDLPEMATCILASGGLSRVFVQQVFGRLLRLSDLGVVTFVDVADRAAYLGRHWRERAAFYASEPAFLLDASVRRLALGIRTSDASVHTE